MNWAFDIALAIANMIEQRAATKGLELKLSADTIALIEKEILDGVKDQRPNKVEV